MYTTFTLPFCRYSVAIMREMQKSPSLRELPCFLICPVLLGRSVNIHFLLPSLQHTYTTLRVGPMMMYIIHNTFQNYITINLKDKPAFFPSDPATSISINLNKARISSSLLFFLPRLESDPPRKLLFFYVCMYSHFMYSCDAQVQSTSYT